MPQVTLLMDPWDEYSLITGRRTLRFVGGESRTVSSEIAQRLSTYRRVDGSPLFQVEDDAPPPPVADSTAGMDIIPPSLKATIASACSIPKVEQNVLGTLRQMGLKDVAL